MCGGGGQGQRAGADHAPPVDAHGGGVAAVAAGHLPRFPILCITFVRKHSKYLDMNQIRKGNARRRLSNLIKEF